MPVQQSISHAVRRTIAAELPFYPLSLETYERALADEFMVDGDIGYSALFLQNYRPADPEVAGYLIGQIHSAIAKGDASIVRIQVGSTPGLDREVAENTRSLMHLPPPFEAHMSFGTDDSDGQLCWDPEHPRAPFPGSPLDQVPLEVGNTDVETLFWHFCQCGGFARWPFGCPWIIAIGKLDPVGRRIE